MLRSRARLAAVLLAAAALLGPMSSASASVNDYLGVWNNPAPHGGVTQIFIEQDRFRIHVRVFGQCHPHDCAWGSVDARMYSPNASGNTWQDAVLLTAHYDQGFSHRLVLLRYRGRGEMSYEIITDFDDNSHRTPYLEEGRLDRQR